MIFLSIAVFAGFFVARDWEEASPRLSVEDAPAQSTSSDRENAVEDMQVSKTMPQQETASTEKTDDIDRVSELKSVFVSGVPFVVQAPGGDWANPRYQDGCEEASMLMAMRWAKNEKIENTKSALDALSQLMEETLGTFYDTSVEDTFLFARGALGDEYVNLETTATIHSMRDALARNQILVVATNGQKLGNPNYTSPGPEYHMLVVIGYDANTDEFIVNDPGTIRGEGYRYKTDILFSAMQNYKTGRHSGTLPNEKPMIVFSQG